MTGVIAPSSGAIVEAADLQLSYGRSLGARRREPPPLALRDVSFRVQPGEALAVIGTNGAGKTTLLRTVAGLLRPTSGHMRVLGAEPWKRSGAFLSRIALISGNRSQLIPELRLRDSLQFARSVFGISGADYHRRIHYLLSELNIEHLIDAPVAQMSLGQRVRADIVMGLLHLPRLVLLDEPSLGLDLDGQEIVRGFFPAYCRREGAGLLLTSHQNLDVVEIGTDVIFLESGSARFAGRMDALLDQHAGALGSTVSVTTSAEPPARPPSLPISEFSWDPVTRVATIEAREASISEVTRWCLENMSVERLVVEHPSRADVLAHVLRSAR